MSDHNANHLLSGASHPTPSRRHRSSSSLSTRSANTAASGLTGISASTIGTTGGIAGSTSSGIAPARDPILSQIYPRETLSRHDSVASSRRSEASSPSLASSLQQGDHFPAYQSHRSSQHGYAPQATNTVGGRAAAAAATHVASSGPTSRFEEAAHHRSELELVKRENEKSEQSATPAGTGSEQQQQQQQQQQLAWDGGCLSTSADWGCIGAATSGWWRRG